MSKSNPKSTKEGRLEETVKRWEEAERGTYGLKKVRTHDFEEIPALKRKELLTEAGPTILTAEGVESCIVMTLKQYEDFIPAELLTPSDRLPQDKTMVRLEGRLFREIN